MRLSKLGVYPSKYLIHSFAAALILQFMASEIHSAPEKVSPKTHIDTVTYQVNDTPFQGLWVTPLKTKPNTTAPTLLMFPDWMGVPPQARIYAEEFAQLGYRVFVGDPYGLGAQPADKKAAGAKAGALRGNLPELRKRTQAALAELHKKSGPGKVVALGFCFGGGAVLELARGGAEIAGSVSIHGNLNTANPLDAKSIRAKVLVLHGGDDPHVPMTQVTDFVKEMQDAQVDWQLFQFGGAVHSFTNPQAGDNPSSGAAFNAKASQRAYQALKIFLKEIEG
jgi:dienelactone hydrolase